METIYAGPDHYAALYDAYTYTKGNGTLSWAGHWPTDGGPGPSGPRIGSTGQAARNLLFTGDVRTATNRAAVASRLANGFAAASAAIDTVQNYQFYRSQGVPEEEAAIRAGLRAGAEAAGSTAGALAGAEAGCALGGFFGAATGPGAIVTCAAGGIVGAVAGSQAGAHIYDNYVEPGWYDYQEDKVDFFRFLQTGRP